MNVRAKSISELWYLVVQAVCEYVCNNCKVGPEKGNPYPNIYHRRVLDGNVNLHTTLQRRKYQVFKTMDIYKHGSMGPQAQCTLNKSNRRILMGWIEYKITIFLLIWHIPKIT